MSRKTRTEWQEWHARRRRIERQFFSDLELLYGKSLVPDFAWLAYRRVRKAGQPVPDWLLKFLDREAARAIASNKRNRKMQRWRDRYYMSREIEQQISQGWLSTEAIHDASRFYLVSEQTARRAYRLFKSCQFQKSQQKLNKTV